MTFISIIMGVDQPKSPYIGQVHHDFDLKKLLDMKKSLQDCIFSIVMFGWVDITDKNL